jgi:DUF1365 family protein
MSPPIEHIRATTFHGRKGAIRNAFRYGVDFVLLDMDEAEQPSSFLLSRNRFNLWSVHDADHGGVRGAGEGPAWARRQLKAAGYRFSPGARLYLLTQPRFLWLRFNPVSFWLVMEDDKLVAAIAEVNNTFGDRHSYICARDGFAPIRPHHEVRAAKIFHVSPFQQKTGGYAFRFNISERSIAIRIELKHAAPGLLATLQGQRAPARATGLAAAAFRRPLGALRVMALIHWQALKLYFKGAKYIPHTTPPASEVSR